jgi:hypothetical protein
VWWKLRIGTSIALLIVSLVWMGQDLFHHLWWQALGTLVAGIITALGVHAINEDNAPQLVVPLVFVFGLSGWFHLAQRSPFFDRDRQQGLQSLTVAFIRLIRTNGLSEIEQNEVSMGIADCSGQSMQDAMVTTTDAMKTLYETPGMSIVDRATGAGTLPTSPEQCLEAYRRLRADRPGAFAQAEKENPWLLKQLQDQ